VGFAKSNLAIILVLFAALLVNSACSEPTKHSLEIPEGFAYSTLKEFAKQTNVEIIYEVPSIVDVKTNAVSGEMTPAEALDLMLSGTPLVFTRDPETRAFAVTSTEASGKSAVVEIQQRQMK